MRIAKVKFLIVLGLIVLAILGPSTLGRKKEVLRETKETGKELEINITLKEGVFPRKA